ncbi:MAG: DUF1292 domain-containing protein [Clostridia bacterium]|nr:DUF1292 domain-containing protein [Clostridia bacterium]MBQ7914019.1 DUF1292 domain-containing protein [Clostridia bacterium]MBQ8505361.1 DUF1292 domain-containing protein [Clostridia bacterium]MBQ8873103.1 DUF1292 domain-containing protein [Clostridia bacterium]MBQ9706742.1 DUF1292 domain-containing protein [Clostridia bacterium]
MLDENKVHTCDCGDEACDCVEDDIVMLEDEDGNEIAFHHVATLERDGKEYACLQEADDEEAVVEIFELVETEEDGESYYNFLIVDDETYEVLYRQLLEEVAAMNNGCDCDEDGCDCGDDCHCHRD